MENLDKIKQKRQDILARMQKAVADNDTEAYSAAVNELMENIAEGVRAEFNGVQQAADQSVLAARGARQLTSEEKDYFQKLGDAMRSSAPKQALSDLDVVMPKTTIDAVFEDMKKDHPLLDVIDFQNTSGLIEVIVNTHTDQLGTWGELTGEITKELTSGFKKVQMTLSKYSAFLPVAKSMLDLGPAYLEAYVRTILAETIYLGLEEAIINGTGKNMPIGMNRDVSEEVSVTGGVYPEKKTVKVTNLDPVTYGALLAKLATNPKGGKRIVKNVIMVVNPTDYFSKIFPATTIRTTDGTYRTDVLPYPTRVIQSVNVKEGKMLLGMGDRYFMGCGNGKDGKITYDDSCRFLEDERVYLTKLYAHGEPKDNNAFLYCDISEMKPSYLQVQVVSGDAAGGVSLMSASGSEKQVAALQEQIVTMQKQMDELTAKLTAAQTDAAQTDAAQTDAAQTDAAQTDAAQTSGAKPTKS